MNIGNFNDIEALKIAINMEKEGLSFYTAMKENTRNAETKEIFSQLAEEEKDHLSTFQNIYETLISSKNQTQSCEDYRVDEYLKHLIDTGVFTQ